MITRTISGEWYTQGSRPVLKSQGGVSQDVGTCEIANLAVECPKASVNLRSRSVIFSVSPIPAVSSSEGPLSSTGYVLWRPRTPVTVLGVKHVVLDGWTPGGVALATYQNATCDNFTLYGNAGTSISDVALKALSTAITPGTMTVGSAVVTASLAACTDVIVKWFGSTCSQPSVAQFQIDYEPTE